LIIPIVLPSRTYPANKPSTTTPIQSGSSRFRHYTRRPSSELTAATQPLWKKWDVSHCEEDGNALVSNLMPAFSAITSRYPSYLADDLMGECLLTLAMTMCDVASCYAYGSDCSFASFIIRISRNACFDYSISDRGVTTGREIKYVAAGTRPERIASFLSKISAILCRDLSEDEVDAIKSMTVAQLAAYTHSLISLVSANDEIGHGDGSRFEETHANSSVLSSAISKLECNQGVAITMHYVQGKSHKEITLATGRTGRQIAYSLERGLAALRLLPELENWYD
jgi:DNA-directed RNA polymerase specialized sigma24 family protein